MDTVEVTTVVYLPPEEVYEFLLGFQSYAEYSEHLTGVRQFGDGEPGTEYELDFSWWKLTYTARSRVTDVDPPNRIDWHIIKDIDAVGQWLVEPHASGEGTEVTMRIRYAPDSANGNALNLPRFVSLDWVVDKITPKVKSEAERVVRRIVADLEGDHRNVELEIETS
ncbi:SRPBCC family protein [Natronomonas gomsonensis]|uniref:SRPBCC family protein n=1 Tax=Natronomonas gomsonensis TaxID=1046043 RepID=UPI0020CA8549|nr:SRPBCC family protein [Natronomonas gomsonensis]MCY4731525.1 SRPBCC family protein [Natronomonas gomsonensis]